jgi:hypothetical protein
LPFVAVLRKEDVGVGLGAQRKFCEVGVKWQLLTFLGGNEAMTL